MHYSWVRDAANTGFDCQLTKLNGTLRDMHCSWPMTQVFDGILGQIQINAKLNNEDVVTHKPHSHHPLYLAVRKIVENILKTALQS